MALTKVKAGNIILTTPSASSNDVTPATTQYVTTAINNLIDGAPATLNTLDEIAAALNDDAALNTTLTNAIAAKLPLAGGTVTGILTLSSADPVVKFTDTAGGDTFGIFASASNYLGFYNFTDSRTDMIIDGSGVLKLLPTRSTYVDASEDASARSHMFVTNDGVGDFNQEAGHLVIQARTHTSVYRDIIFAGGINNADALMVITGEGRVGIGTDSPADRLHVALDSSTTNAEVEVMRVEATSSGTPAVGFGPFIDFRGDRINGGPDSYGRLGFEADSMPSTTVDGAFIVQTAQDGTYSERMRISSDGKVGIGDNTSPAYTLEVKKDVAGDWISRIYNTNNAAGYGALIRTDATAANDAVALGVYADSGYKMVVRSTGKVGIGTNAPQGNLDINTETAEATTVILNGEANQDKILKFRHHGNSEAAGAGYAGFIGSVINDTLTLGHYNSANTEVQALHINESGIVTEPQKPIFDVAIAAAGSGVRVFDTVYVNVGSHYSTTNGRFTAPVAGTYFFQTAYIKNNDTGVTRRRFNKNGSALYSSRQMRTDAGQSYGDPGTVAIIVTLAVGDYVQVDQYAGQSLGSTTYDYFHGYLIA